MSRIPSLLIAAALCAGCAAAQVKITPGSEKIAIEIDGKPFSDFYIAGAAVTKPYLHPLRAPSGTYITRMWPMEDVAEEQGTKKDHQHQRGLWFAHEKVNGLDFWNNEASYTTPDRGKIVLKKMSKVGKREEPGIDRRDLRLDRPGGRRPAHRGACDDVLCAAGRPDVRSRHHADAGEGGDLRRCQGWRVRIRMRPLLQEQGGSGHIVNADGQAGEKAAWGKPSNWCDYSGEIKGEKVGVAVMDHPENPRHPVRWHARGYGLFAANPFGVSVFTGDKSAKADLTAEPGKKLRFRYRVVIHSGDAQSANIAGLCGVSTTGK